MERKGCKFGGGRVNGAGGGIGPVGLAAEGALGFAALLGAPFAMVLEIAG